MNSDEELMGTGRSVLGREWNIPAAVGVEVGVFVYVWCLELFPFPVRSPGSAVVFYEYCPVA